MEYNTTMEYFERKMGSKVWPSVDPTDSPIDTFKCKLCGWEVKIPMFGIQFVGDKCFEDKAINILRDHLIVHLIEKVRK